MSNTEVVYKIIEFLITPDPNGTLLTDDFKNIIKIKSGELKEIISRIHPEVKATKRPGSNNSSDLKWYGLRLKTPMDRFQSSPIIVFCATVFETNEAESMLEYGVSFNANIHDVNIFSQGFIHGVPISLVGCNDKGQRRMYVATSFVPDLLTGAKYFYKWGAACG